jgi:predicted transcriptional regulator
MLYRTRVEIFSQILDVAISEISKTRTMYQAYLSYQQLNRYLKLLVDLGYLYFDNDFSMKRNDKNIAGRSLLESARDRCTWFRLCNDTHRC